MTLANKKKENDIGHFIPSYDETRVPNQLRRMSEKFRGPHGVSSGCHEEANGAKAPVPAPAKKCVSPL
ncbi:unnamed protein product [Dovyalis caffra]|uniref:Uncharacterized protein n=1 Tax=Dovyalis caffra TaxID=77055 RepID=A0AAV1SCN8_9ROSI|nr:unnamed protein product [Dovyalis caffra]